MLGEEVKLLPNKPKETLEIDSSLHYLQIISVDPYMADQNQRESTFAKQHNLNEFSIETPYAPPGEKYSEDVGQQWKQRTIFQTARFFPSLTLRMYSTSQPSLVWLLADKPVQETFVHLAVA